MDEQMVHQLMLSLNAAMATCHAALGVLSASLEPEPDQEEQTGCPHKLTKEIKVLGKDGGNTVMCMACGEEIDGVHPR